MSLPRRLVVAAALAAVIVGPSGAPLRAQQAPLSAADSTLIYDIVTAEERRDASAPALAAGLAHRDPRLRALSARAKERITDSTFKMREALGRPGARAMPTWPLPEWAARFRAISARTVSCDTLLIASRDPAIHVRVRALSIAGSQASCRAHPEMLTRLSQLAAAAPREARRNRRDAETWHEVSAALVSYALLVPDSAARQIERLSRQGRPQLRRAAARAAVATRDTSLLLRLANDRDPNVSEAAITGLARLSGHLHDTVFLKKLIGTPPQVALAAATALEGSRSPALTPAAQGALAEYQRRDVASERDVRTALRRLLGDTAPEPWRLRQTQPLPRDVIALALGEPRYLRVTASRAAGGGSFTVELRGDVAPIMAARVLARVRAGAYDRQTWHRVEPGFVIQGGSPWDNEYSGSASFFVDELSTVAHPRGSVGMSTRGHDTGDAQWFINLRDNARLMADYTVFAVVIEGMEVVDAVLEGDAFATIREVSAPRR